ncbi:MAG: D-alanine--D-alanine ligase [Anaerolineales bacterium]|nr:D-alanine--D-alanine ligase [Anaerolineales bacterium]
MEKASDPKRKKIRIGLVFGGRSGEHEVSLQSARSVMEAIDREKFEIIPIGITKRGRWLTGSDPMKALEMEAKSLPLLESEELARPSTLLGEQGQRSIMQIQQTDQNDIVLSGEAALDVIFPVLHGPYGEDGTVQGLLELAGIPYVGAGVVGSAVAMDKVIFKKVMAAEQIPVLPNQLVLRSEWDNDPDGVVERIESNLNYPMFTKPANLGSSVGISRCSDRKTLIEGIGEAALFDRRLVVEQGIDAREIECSVLGNDDPIASIAGEIVPSQEFYSYQAKYLDEGDAASGLLIPAPISDELMEQVRSWSVQAYKAIDCAGLARVDFLMDKTTGELYMNEINTIPGFTSISMYPKLWAATGISYPELIERLIYLALDRFEDKERTQSEYKSK